MLNEIHKSGRFKNDYDRYKAAIDTLPEGDFKSRMSLTLDKLVSEIKKLDGLHAEMVYTKQLPSMGTDLKSIITELRRDLDIGLKQYMN
jgi:hypothetical protein